MRSYALVCAVGDESMHDPWIDDARVFDVILIYFGDDPEIASRYAEQADLFIRAKGQKLHMIYRLVKEKKLFISEYEYVWFPDDDLRISVEDVNALFQNSEKYGALVSQPACIGFTSHAVTKPNTRRLVLARSTGFVEVMAPCFQREALSQCLESFGEEESSFGVDDVWFAILGKPKRGFMIFDEIIMEHMKPVSSLARFPNALENAARLREKYGVERNRNVLGFLVWPGLWVPEWIFQTHKKLIRWASR